MKKMVCEICGSQSIKKEDGVFVCQECGTQYSTEEAKKLLSEINEVKDNTSPKESAEKPKVVSENDKYELLKKLCLWADLLKEVECFKELKIQTNTPKLWGLNKGNLNQIEDRLLEETLFKYYIESKIQKITDIRTKDAFQESILDYYLPIVVLNENDIPSDIKNEYEFWKSRASKFESTYSSNGSFKIGSTTYYVSTKEAKWLVEHAISQNSNLIDWCYSVATSASVHDSLTVFKASLFRSETHDFNKMGVRLKSIIDDKESVYEKDMNEKLIPAIESRKQELLKLVEVSKELEEIFNLPVEYRTLDAVFFMIKAIYDGKVDSWKEAVLLLDETNFRNTMLFKLSEISSQLSIIDKKITIGFTTISNQLTLMNRRLTDIHNSIKESNDSLKAIGVFAAIAAFGS